MKIVLLLIPITLMLVSLGILLFVWAVRNGQYDDLEGPAHRILYDDDKDMIPEDARPEDGKAEGESRQASAEPAPDTDDQSTTHHREPPH